jgi:large subunit ribosomal protein L30
MIYAVVRVRGNVNKKQEIKDTMRMLRLTRVNHCVLIRKDPKTDGMIKKVKDFVTWGEISDDTLAKLVSGRGRKAGDARLSEKEVGEVLESYKKKKNAYDVKDFKHVFRMAAPRKGYNGVKNAFPKGALGYRGEKINELLERMM